MAWNSKRRYGAGLAADNNRKKKMSDAPAAPDAAASAAEGCSRVLNVEGVGRLTHNVLTGQSVGRACAECGAVDTRMKKCGGCMTVSYCSRECQRRAWPNHKTICSEMNLNTFLTTARFNATPPQTFAQDNAITTKAAQWLTATPGMLQRLGEEAREERRRGRLPVFVVGYKRDENERFFHNFTADPRAEKFFPEHMLRPVEESKETSGYVVVVLLIQIGEDSTVCRARV